MIVEQIKRYARTIGMDKAIANSLGSRIVQVFIGVVSTFNIASFIVVKIFLTISRIGYELIITSY